MIQRIIGLYKRYQGLQNKKPTLFLILRYFLLWIILCMITTGISGRQYFESRQKKISVAMDEYVQIVTYKLREAIRTKQMNYRDEKALIDYTLQQINAIGVSAGMGDCHVVSFYSHGSASFYTNEEEINDKAILVIGSEEDQYKPDQLYYCSVDYLADVLKETLNVKKNNSTKWISPLHNSPRYEGWDISLVDGYVNGQVFRPGKVRIQYITGGKVTEEKILDCHSEYNTRNFEYMGELKSNQVLIPEDCERWKLMSRQEAILMTYGSGKEGKMTVIYPVFYFTNPSQYDIYEMEELNKAYLSKNYDEAFNVFGKLYAKPFSFLKGDFVYAFVEKIMDASGEPIFIGFYCYCEGGLKNYVPLFFLGMSLDYLFLLLLMAFFAWRSYRRYYSLRAKNGFHKSLINSMAHDLKTPLMIMQGFGENLVENVHSEKRDYYARQILSNIKYLNELVNKNLDLSKKKDGETVARDIVYLMDLVVETQGRLQELLDQKNLTIDKRGETLVHGDRELLGTVVDNLIVNAIKYSPEGSVIEVTGAVNIFVVRNKANLRYKKNINHLLDPLEMGDESRTSGKGTGLGLSIANGIVTEHGWRMKLKYKKREHLFSVIIKIPRINK